MQQVGHKIDSGFERMEDLIRNGHITEVLPHKPSPDVGEIVEIDNKKAAIDLDQLMVPSQYMSPMKFCQQNHCSKAKIFKRMAAT